MAVIKLLKHPTSHFTMLPNAWLRDGRLSYRARGILAFLLSHSGGFQITQDTLVNSGTEGPAAMRSALHELEATGYLRRVRTPLPTGGSYVDYIVSEPTDEPEPEDAEIALSEPEGAKTERSEIASSADQPELPISAGQPRVRFPHPRTSLKKEEQEKTIFRSTGVEHARKTPPSDEESGFAEFWSAYPRRVGKGQARRAWLTALRKTTPDVIMAGVRAYTTNPIRSREPQFTAHPATWLNGERWLDERHVTPPPPPPPAPRKSRPYWDA